jgi:Putative metallopeptidase domain
MTQNKDDPFAVIEAEAARQALCEAAGKALTAARGRLILGRDAASAFFATLVLRLTPEVDPACETIATDGKTLSYAPAFVTGLSADELVGVLAHEVLHCALAHPHRRVGREPSRWNVACDLAVNPILLQAGFTLPASRLLPGEGTYRALPVGKSADEYYALLIDESSVPEPENASGDGASDATDDPRAGSSDDPGGCGGVTTRSISTPRWAASKLAAMLCRPGWSCQYPLALTQATDRYSRRSALFSNFS